MRAALRWALFVALASVLLLGLTAFGGAAQAQAGPFFASQASPDRRYELHLEASYSVATRDRFSTPVFLFAQWLRSIEARQLKTEADVRFRLTPSLALQVVVPVAYREAHVELEPLVVSADQVLTGARRTLTSYGLLDPLLAAAYRLLSSQAVDLFVDLGTRVPIDDNPESTAFPKRVPLSTGQNELFAGAGGNLRVGRLDAALDYRFAYYPGNSATYLVRRFGAQSYVSGALDDHFKHSIRAQLSAQLSDVWSVSLRSQWSALAIPHLIQSDGPVRFTDAVWLQTWGGRLAVGFWFEQNQRFELFYDQPFLDGYQDDPFFPIVMPERGAGLIYRAWSQ